MQGHISTTRLPLKAWLFKFNINNIVACPLRDIHRSLTTPHLFLTLVFNHTTYGTKNNINNSFLFDLKLVSCSRSIRNRELESVQFLIPYGKNLCSIVEEAS